MQALEDLRKGLMHGQRVALPSEQRHQLEKGSPLFGEVSYDAKHRPVSTNVSKHMKHIRTINGGSDIRLHGLLPGKTRTAQGKSGGTTVLVATLAGESKLTLTTPDGVPRLQDFDLGHHVTHMSLSTHPDNSYVLTGDAASGELRVLMVELMGNAAPSDSKGSASEKEGDGEEHPAKPLTIVANTTAKFMLPREEGDGRRITAVLAVGRSGSAQPNFLAADSLGSVAIFFKNGTLKGRIKVTDDAGGVKGLLRGQGQTVLFYSSHSFGFLNIANIDVMTAPCSGWNSPIFDIAPDPTSTYPRVVLALEDGDVLVFSTVTGKNKDKTCDLTMKFPRISTLPFKLHVVRGHIMGLPTPLESTKQPDEYHRELYFFNLNAMEGGYGAAQSRVVTLQASFEPRRLNSFALLTASGSANSGSGKVHLALQFAEDRGSLDLYELTLKTPTAPAAAAGGGGSSAGSGISAWLDWIPKVGIFGITLIGVVVWNVRKVSSKPKAGSGLEDFDDDFLRERLRKKREGGGDGDSMKLDASSEKLEKLLAKAKKQTAGAASGSSGPSGDALGELSQSAKEMEELLASMDDREDD